MGLLVVVQVMGEVATGQACLEGMARLPQAQGKTESYWYGGNNMKYALIYKQTGKVVNVVDESFSVPGDYLFIECADMVKPGMEYQNNQFFDPDVPTFDKAKASKLDELNSAFDTAAQNAHLMSSVGFEIDANEVANRNIEGLVLVMSDTDTTMFCDYNNEFHEVTKAQLETMRKEIVVNSQRLYQVKWTYRTQIEAATTVEELDAIQIEIA